MCVCVGGRQTDRQTQRQENNLSAPMLTVNPVDKEDTELDSSTGIDKCYKTLV